MFDLHRHDQFSQFDGMGKAMELAHLAKELGYTALGTSNHGNTNGLVEHYLGCTEAGIKPILGVEAYFQPKFNKEKKTYHLCLFAKNLKGYENINRIMTIGNLEKKYYKPICDFEVLEEYCEGVICTTACVGSYFSQLILNNKMDIARKALIKFHDIFGDDFYIEIQPYKLSDEGMQEKVNEGLIYLAKRLDIKMIFTSDSHFPRKEDFDTYLKIHAFKNSKYGEHYHERYMPTAKQYFKRFMKMHGETYGEKYAQTLAQEMLDNLDEIEEKVEADIIDQLKMEMPVLAGDGGNSDDLLWKNIKRGLKKRGVYTREYVARCKDEYDVIKAHGFADYFLIVEEYTNWAKEQGISVGPGRGSVCNCEISYALGITDVDALYFGLDFKRFLRMDKKKLPDIDLDFETDRRQEVIDHILETYPGQSSQICSYGLYRFDNLLNDLFKVCGVDEKEDQAEVKKYVKSFSHKYNDYEYNMQGLLDHEDTHYYNAKYDNIIKHFSKLYKSVRYIGTHAAGVAVTGGDLLQHTAIEFHSGKTTVAYDLNNLEFTKAIKFDILGLVNLSQIKELRQLTGHTFDNLWFEDEEVYRYFRDGKTEGIFQFEGNVAKSVLQQIETDCMEDVIAANALNRPGPLAMKMPAQYAYNKQNIKDAKKALWYEYTKDTYGTTVYQEQVTAVCMGIGGLDYAQADKVLKLMKGGTHTESSMKERNENEHKLRAAFIAGAKTKGIDKKQANEIFDSMVVYSFNKGHAVGYALIAFQQMWYKVHYPEEFWYVTMKYGEDEHCKVRANAVFGGSIIILPHVNGRAKVSLTKYDGSRVIQEGLLSIKNVGAKAAEEIERERLENGKYKSVDNFVNRVNRSVVNKRVIDALMDAGALEFDTKVYEARTEKYNSSMYMKIH